MSSALPASYPWLVGALGPLLAIRAARRGGGRRLLAERLGRGRAPPAGAVWIHAASVGETATVRPLAEALIAAGRTVLLTTQTPTGAAVAAGIAGAAHAYLPLDLRGPVRRFLARARPLCGLIVETELWPVLYAEAAARGIPLAIVNGRLSPRSLRAGRYHRRLAAAALGHVTAVLARSAADAEGFVRLGAPAERVEVTGNLKFAPAASPALEGPPPLPRPYVLAASTHADEERRIAALWQDLRPEGWLLAVAPRHPERGAAVASELTRLGLRVARRSRGEAVQADTDVFLLDTVGELPAYLAHAEVVVMGGSLVPRGGHNLLEPARLGRAVVVGPHMENFADETAQLVAADAVVRVDDDAGLAAALRRLAADPAARHGLGERARAVVEAEAGIVDRYLERLAARGVLPSR